MQNIKQQRKRYQGQFKRNNPEFFQSSYPKNRDLSRICNRSNSGYHNYQKSKSQFRGGKNRSIPYSLPILKQNTDLLVNFFQSEYKKNFQIKRYLRGKKNSNNKEQTVKKNYFTFQSQAYQGLREYNEDRILIKTNIEINKKQYNLFAIFDGHGGSSTSQYLKIHFCKTLQKYLKQKQNVLQSLQCSLYQMQNKIQQFGNKILSGSCAIVCILHDMKYYVANIGDSRILKISQNGKFVQITNDHKPETEIQRQRIQRQGGRIYRQQGYNYITQQKYYGPFRMFPSKLSISRSIGDNQHKKKVNGNALSSTPDFFSGKLFSSDLLVLTSDGGYQKFTNFEIAKIFNSSSGNISQKVKEFIRKCKIRSTVDNVSVIGIQLNSLLRFQNN